VAILTTFLAVLGLTGLVEVSFFVQFLVALIGLGLPSTTRCYWSPAGGRSWRRATTAPRRSSGPWPPPGGRW
jgi:hypothetical protein